MTAKYDDSYFDALTRLAYDPPPITCPGLTVSVIRIRPPGAFPEILVEDQLYPVIGVTATGWLSTAQLGWCQYIGDPAPLPQITRACNLAQQELIKEGDKLKAAIARYAARDDASTDTASRYTHAGARP
ncbi:hypothetical protein ROSMUCSMR3_01392 [Roseovarius mucosus]|uniref:Uncharacterized protein n=1 Tax=Roseovarius mucosus TaxID=215743 RepID=A0A1V0RML8_9RHOB|nr:hypothetical protein [Roseovarius mucosus]ARE82885.1 hypothetical protein ROSMUCSMR3_01392 [Roseovarius mucosus]